MRQTDHEETRKYVEAIFAHGKPTFQVFCESAECNHRPMWLYGSFHELADKLTSLNDNGAGIFLMVNEGDGNGRRTEHVQKISAVFADDDTQSEEYRTDWPLNPHIVVESSHGKFHYYWLLDPADSLQLSEFATVQKAIAAQYGTDHKVHDLPRVMRLPGFYHQKGEPFLSRLVFINENLPRYSRQDILNAFGQPQALQAGDIQQLVIPEGARNDAMYRTGHVMRENGVPCHDIERGLQAANQLYCHPPLRQSEVRTIAGSVMLKYNEEVVPAELPSPGVLDLTVLPAPRPILYGGHIIKGYVTGTAATGGTGKTALLDVEAISLALGRDLLDEQKPLKVGPQKVLLLSLEDDVDECKRRHKAIFIHYGLSEEDDRQYRENLYTIFDSDGVLKVQRRDGRGLHTNGATIEHLTKSIAKHGISVVVIDPLVSIHEADENSNTEVQAVLTQLRSIARQQNVAVHYLHHTRKGGGSSADDMRGAVALRDGSRALRTISRMTDEEMKAMGVGREEAQRLIGIATGKSNFSAAGNTKQWCQLNSICLDNGDEYFNADNVAVVSAYNPRDVFDGISNEQLEAALSVIKSLRVQQMRYNHQATAWLGVAIAPPLGLDAQRDKAQIRRIIQRWEESGILGRYEVLDEKKVRMVPYYRLVEQPNGEDPTGIE